MQTPWGLAQTIKTVAPGIQLVTTSSHGGYLLDPARSAAMPAYMAGKKFTEGRSAYEEDCDWCMPALVFEPEFRAFLTKTGSPDVETVFKSAKETLRHWLPDAYEIFYGVTLQPGESRERDQQKFNIDNKANWITTAAWGDWKNGVPKGMVGVCTRLGGRSSANSSAERYFLVPADEYRGGALPFGFVIDPDRHAESPPLV
jgi:hypothetical protein